MGNKNQNEIYASRPVQYFALDGLTGGGHSFIVDGYDDINIEFHINWGLNGTDNGWFEIGEFAPDPGENYNFLQRAIFNLHPDWNQAYDCNSNLTILHDFKNNPFNFPFFYFPLAGNIISSPAPLIIENNESVIYRAHNSITLRNFNVKQGCTFIATIIDCPNSCPLPPTANKSMICTNEFENPVVTPPIDLNSAIIVFPNPNDGMVYLQYQSQNTVMNP